MMNNILQDSIILITSKDPNCNAFGTGFIFWKDTNSTYAITCAHVIDALGGPNNIYVKEFEAQIVVCGDPKGAQDVAVIRIEGIIPAEPLPLGAPVSSNSHCISIGYQNFGTLHLIRPLEIRLGHSIAIEQTKNYARVSGWDVIILDDYKLQNGYSGSPIISKDTNRVIGILSHRIGTGEKGIGISLEVVKEVWADIPAELISYFSINNSITINSIIDVKSQCTGFEFDYNDRQWRPLQIQEDIRANTQDLHSFLMSEKGTDRNSITECYISGFT